MPATRRNDRSEYWRRLGLIPGAPECVIKAAHRAQIELHHPDRGGDAAAATSINVAYDEVRGLGTPANEYVATNYGAEPWVVLGITSAAGEAMAKRAGKQLLAELPANGRLADRVRWAIANFSRAHPAATARNGAAPPPAPPRARRATAAKPGPQAPARPGVPEGLPLKVDFGRVAWQSEATKTFQLTWKQFAPFDVTVEAPPPLVATVTASKVLPGRFSVALSIDWTSPEFASPSKLRGQTLDAEIVVRWTSTDSVPVRVRGLLLYRAVVMVAPSELDLGTVRAGSTVRASLVLTTSGPAEATIETPAWLARVDGAGRAVDAPVTLAGDTPVRVGLRVHWPPILERGDASLRAGRPVRPSGKIIVRCGAQTIEVPAHMIATPE